jgi:uncharacterized protein YceK
MARPLQCLSVPSLVPDKIGHGLDACVTLRLVVTMPELNRSRSATVFLVEETHAWNRAHQCLGLPRQLLLDAVEL